MGKKKKRKKESTVDALRVVTEGIKDLMLVSGMEDLICVPTLLTGYNRATGIGGHPLGRIMIVHGPEQVGKSILSMIVAESLRRAGHVSKVDDTEWAAEKEWYSLITPKSFLGHPRTLDDMRISINEMLDNLEKGKKARKKAERIPDEIGIVRIVDTVSILRPKRIMEKIEKEGIDKMYPLVAAWLTDWMSEVVPRIRLTNSSLILVSQEREVMGAGQFERKWRIPGGNALKYDNCLRVRVKYSKKVERGDQLVGMESVYEVANNKVDGTTWEEASFFTSNGRGDVPKGLDLVREAVSEGKRRGVLEFEGNHVSVKFDNPAYSDWDGISGGWESARLFFMENLKEFNRFVKCLNEDARRKS